ncbi:hypothetical protein JX265_003872 [Neoarthrinium moseri]|uniref:NTF2 domain-containing protein n=1 Tax=Neoarthrinium moseri TaxID=1658444 RepID=A0A9P9WRG1_9PEZI|nr:hypothetical protein JX266_001778 [Neoarthrinium moseri]KAI1876346.1 hypothetical protein JX265_003872 [Neoarthrinium moseri]
MPLPSIETQSKVATADRFVEHYYDALNKNQRGQLAQYYCSTSNKLTAASLTPDISFNGRVITSVPELQELLEKQGTPVHFEVLSYDAHPVNPHYIIGAPDAQAQSDKGDKLSFVVQVTGTVKFGKGDEATHKSFNESFVMVPHWEAQVKNAPRGLKRWLVASQNSRYL